MAQPEAAENLLKTPLFDEHIALDARMVPFAGYQMPVQYPSGIITEHTHTRRKAGLFDVSHMGQLWLKGPDHETTAAALESLVPADIVNLKPGRQRYSQLLNDSGGCIDDLMIARPEESDRNGWLYLVINASRKDADMPHMKAHLADTITLEEMPDKALMALQGPASEQVLESLIAGVGELAFMQTRNFTFAGSPVGITRSGYSGEDGYEISVPGEQAAALWRSLCDHSEVIPVGLGARDSLRLEAGLCLYGHELNETISPIEAGLAWSIQKRRREEGGFPGAQRIQAELRDGPSRIRVGLLPEGRAPAREGTTIHDANGAEIGIVTSGGFGPSVGGPVAIGYVTPETSEPGSEVSLLVRGKLLPARITEMPFVKQSYKR